MTESPISIRGTGRKNTAVADRRNPAPESWGVEGLLEDISLLLTDPPFEQIDENIPTALAMICDFLSLDCSAMLVIERDAPHEIHRSYYHNLQQNEPVGSFLNDCGGMQWIVRNALAGDSITFSSKAPLSAQSGAMGEALLQCGVNDLFTFPVPLCTSSCGVLLFSTSGEKSLRSRDMLRKLNLLSSVVSTSLKSKYREHEIQERLEFERLLLELSASFASLSADNLDSHIEKTQQAICRGLDLDLSALWQWSDSKPRHMTLTHLYTIDGGPKRPEVELTAEKSFPWALERLVQGNHLIMYTEEMPEEAQVDRENRRSYGIQSSVAFPLCTVGGAMLGILTFDAIRKKKVWQQPIVDRLSIIAQIFTSAFTRKRNELKITESEKRLRLATDATDIGMWVMHLDTGFVWATPVTRRIFRFGGDELLSYESFKGKILEQDLERVMQAVEDAIRSEGLMHVEFRVSRSDRSIRWVCSKGKAYHDGTGEPDRLIGITLDITERKLMEEKLRTQLSEIQLLKQDLEAENKYLQKRIEVQNVHEEVVARSPEMRKVMSQVEQVAGTDATVLVEGETGTGKELVARAVHRLSGRSRTPLITVNCASLPPTLVESELFGREKGAYTGAMTKMVGRFELADGATLFLDEVSELPLEIQAKLLRVIEEGSFERLGSSTTITTDVRIVAASNQDLSKLVAAGTFRQDLYYRLNIFPVTLPPLRERCTDIPLLTWHFVRKYEGKMGKRIENIPKQCMEKLQQYDWPGNVRELRNVIERSLIICEGRTLQIQMPRQREDGTYDNATLEDMERRHIRSVLARTGWRISGNGSASTILGLKRTTLQSKMKKLGIERPRIGAGEKAK